MFFTFQNGKTVWANPDCKYLCYKLYLLSDEKAKQKTMIVKRAGIIMLTLAIIEVVGLGLFFICTSETVIQMISSFIASLITLSIVLFCARGLRRLCKESRSEDLKTIRGGFANGCMVSTNGLAYITLLEACGVSLDKLRRTVQGNPGTLEPILCRYITIYREIKKSPNKEAADEQVRKLARNTAVAIRRAIAIWQ